MKIAIAGPGRSGTSILVELFGAWGFSVPTDEWFRAVEAGLESRLGSGSPFEVDKDPWAYEYISGIDLSEYDFVLIPLRNRLEATTSRSTQQRFAAATSVSDDRWKWRTGGTVPGGAVVKQSREAISESVSEGLWDILHGLVSAGVRPIFLDFPRFVEDFEYLWGEIGQIVGKKIGKKEAKILWTDLVNPDKVRFRENSNAERPTVSQDELEKLVDLLRVELRKAVSERDQAVSDRDQARNNLAQITQTRSWRWTRGFRALRKAIGETTGGN